MKILRSSGLLIPSSNPLCSRFGTCEVARPLCLLQHMASRPSAKLISICESGWSWVVRCLRSTSIHGAPSLQQLATITACASGICGRGGAAVSPARPGSQSIQLLRGARTTFCSTTNSSQRQRIVGIVTSNCIFFWHVRQVSFEKGEGRLVLTSSYDGTVKICSTTDWKVVKAQSLCRLPSRFAQLERLGDRCSPCGSGVTSVALAAACSTAAQKRPGGGGGFSTPRLEVPLSPKGSVPGRVVPAKPQGSKAAKPSAHGRPQSPSAPLLWSLKPLSSAL